MDPELGLWVSESRRQIVLVDADGERRIAETDDTNFALAVAELERFYGAIPTAGGRDSSALLVKDAIGTSRRRSLFVPLPALAGRWRTRGERADDHRAAQRRAERRKAMLDVIHGVVLIGPFVLAGLMVVAVAVLDCIDAIKQDLATEAEWLAWGERQGSEQLRATLREDDDELKGELFAQEVASALVPPFNGATRCPVDASVRAALPMSASDRELADRARYAVTLAAANFPKAATVEVGELSACWLPGRQTTERCLPVTLREGYFTVETCYVLPAP